MGLLQQAYKATGQKFTPATSSGQPSSGLLQQAQSAIKKPSTTKTTTIKKTTPIKKTPTKNTEPISSTKYKIKGVDLGRLGQSVKSGAELVPSQFKTAGGIVLSSIARNSEKANQFFGKVETAQNIIRPKFIEKATAQVRAQKRLGNQAMEFKATKLRESGARESTKKLEDVSKRMTPSTGLQSYLEMAAFNLPQMAATTGLTIATGIVTRNPLLATTVGLSTSYGLGASEVYSEARRGGLKDAEAMPLAQVGGTIIGAIDFVPLGRLLRKTGAIKTVQKSITKKVAQGIVSLGIQAGFEGVTEGAQEIIGNAIKSTYKESQNLFEGVKEATVVGTLLGGFSDVTVAGVTGAVGNKATPEKVVDHVNKQIEKALNTPPNKRTQEQELLVRTMSERVVTPDEALAMVIDMGIENTEVGRKLVLASLEAKEADQDVRITQNRSAKEINLEVVDRDSAIQQKETPPLSPTEEIADGGVEEQGSTEPLTQEARKYKSAEEFVNKNAPLPGLVGTDKDLLGNIQKAKDNLDIYKQRGDTGGIKGETDYIKTRQAILNKRSQLTDIWNKANEKKVKVQEEVKTKKKITTKTTPPRKKGKSRVFERLQQENPEQLKGELPYDIAILKTEFDKATNRISKNKQEAYEIAMGRREVSDVESVVTNIEMAEKALSDNNTELYEKLVRNRSLAQTRRGQAIVAEKASIEDNSTARYVKDLLSSRLDKLGNRYLSGLKDGQSIKKRAVEIIDGKVDTLEVNIKRGKLDVKTALKLLDELSCI